MKPVIKWAGGKSRLLPELLQRMPHHYRRYYEPFFGGGALFFNHQPKSATINDANPHLMSFYAAVRDQPEAVIRHLKARIQAEDEFYAIRSLWNANEGTVA